MTEDCEYRKFLSYISSRQQYSQYTLSGSATELPVLYVFNNVTDLDLLESDVDMCAVPKCKAQSTHFKGKVLTIDTSKVHVGYARLKNDAGRFHRRQIEPSELLAANIRITQNGPARRKYFPGLSLIKNLMCMINEKWQHVKEIEIDFVESVYCPFWPPEAEEWKNRDRLNGWPPRHIVDEIIAGGCHFVQKPHPSNPDDDEQWRFSFSQAEVILVHSWTDTQKYVYHILRLIKSEVVKDCERFGKPILNSYLFKTLMFWTCEEKPSEFWEESKLETTVGELICLMIEWLIERRCLNYFIPSNNMIDHLSETYDLSPEIKRLLYHKELYVSLLLSKTTRAYPRISCVFEFPSQGLLLFVLLVINYRMNFFQIKAKGSSLVDFSRISSCFPELRTLFFGLRRQLRLATRALDNEEKRVIEQDALECFKGATVARDTGSLFKIMSLSDSLLEIAEDFILGRDLTEEDISMHPVLNDNSKHCLLIQILQKWTKHYSRIIPQLSYFVCAAYLANFYYTTMQEYELADNICLEMHNTLFVIRQFIRVIQLADVTKRFVVIVSNEWSAVFDEFIQTIFGFITLQQIVNRSSCAESTRVTRDKNSQLLIRICPEIFTMYIRYQCSRKLQRLSKEDEFPRFRGNDETEYRTNDSEAFSHVVLSAALYASRAYNN